MKGELECILENGKKVILGGDWNARIGPMGAMEEDQEERATQDRRKNEEGQRHMDYIF